MESKTLPNCVQYLNLPRGQNIVYVLLFLFIVVCSNEIFGQISDQEKDKIENLKREKGLFDKEKSVQSLERVSTQGLQIIQKAEKPLLQQTVDEKCGFVAVENMLKEKYPKRATSEEFEKWMSETLQQAKLSLNAQREGLVTIPVVVHVIHDGSAVGGLPNISDAQVLSQIEVLNEDFRRLNADASNTPNDFLGVASDVEIEFCLATVDPDGNPTNGINRYNGGQTSYSIADMENVIKPNTIWHPDFYFNIWCAPLPGGLLGYAQFPSMSGLDGFDDDEGPARTDGVVVRDLAFGRNGSSQSPFNLGRTATHEVGHFFGLRHIGGDGSCSVDDFCADTPTQAGQNTTSVSDCSYPQDNDCDDGEGDLPDQFMNYMDYSDDACMNMFTLDQKARFDVVLDVSPRRNSLITSEVCNGVPPDYPFDPYEDAPPNDFCEDAETISCGDTITGDTSTASARDIPPACVSGPDGAGIWYVLEGTGTEVTAIMCGSSYDTKLNVYSGSCGDLTCVGGNDDSCGLSSEVTFTAEEGETYYVYVNGFNGAVGEFTLDISCSDDPPPPPGDDNDLCEDAVEVECGDIVEGTTIGASQDLTGSCNGISVGAPGVWYSITGTGEFITASLCEGTNYDSKIHIIQADDCNSELLCIDGDDDGCGVFGGPSSSSFFGEEGVNYFIYVNGFNGAVGDFTLSIECNPPPENDLCENAIPLECESTVEGNTDFASATGAPETDCSEDPFSDDMGPGIWYTIEGTGAAINLSTCGTADYDTKIDVFEGSCGELTCVAGNDDGEDCTGFTSELEFESEMGVTYYVYVSGFTSAFGTSTGNFTLTVDCQCVVDAGECQTVYSGYEPESCTDLTASAQYGVEPYIYEWSTGETGETITVCPDETTTYTVTITDAEGCVSTDDVTVKVVDVTCGRNGDRVELCMPRGSRDVNLCLPPAAVPGLLRAGARLGNCDENTDCATEEEITYAKAEVGEEIKVFPNPNTSGVLTIDLSSLKDGDYAIELVNHFGRRVEYQEVENGKSQPVILNTSGLRSGLYVVRILSSEGIITRNVVIE